MTKHQVPGNIPGNRGIKSRHLLSLCELVSEAGTLLRTLGGPSRDLVGLRGTLEFKDSQPRLDSGSRFQNSEVLADTSARMGTQHQEGMERQELRLKARCLETRDQQLR